MEQGVVQGCSLSPFFVFIDDLLRKGKKVGGMLFADDFAGLSGSKEGLQKRNINVVHGYCNKWRL